MKTKKQLENELIVLLKEMRSSGITLMVASDDEGNGFNVINPDNTLYGGSKKGFIVLGTWGRKYQEEILFDCDICEDTGEVSTDERDSDGNWQRGVGTQICECRNKDFDDSDSSESDLAERDLKDEK